jgi:hypothetical protein
MTHILLRGLLRIATNWCTGEVAGSIQVMGITDLRAHPERIFWPSRDAAIYNRRLRAQSSADGPPYV